MYAYLDNTRGAWNKAQKAARGGPEALRTFWEQQTNTSDPRLFHPWLAGLIISTLDRIDWERLVAILTE